MKFVPILNTVAGLTLTPHQWQSTGSIYYAFDVLELMKRPGVIAMKLKAPGPIVLDGRHLTFNAKKQIIYRKVDGARGTIDEQEFIDWLMALGAIAWLGPSVDFNTPLELFQEIPISDKPAKDGYHGIFYTEQASFDIQAAQFERDMNLLDSHCSCETCSQGFTRAYFHHLFTHTPLLAQRMLIAHNVFYAQLHGISAV